VAPRTHDPWLVRGLLALLCAACGAEPEDSGAQYRNVLPFDTARVRIASRTDTATLTVELAESREQQTLGLMERRTLAEDAGMLFVYRDTQPATAGFWMYRTRIPLDIAFVDDSGVIRSIRAMEPCTSDLAAACPTYEATIPYRAALEVNRGYFARRQIRVGDRVLLQDTVTRQRSADAR
jgi:uncharacterized membrane protein (UPF0127 family)